jgi:DNA polymerase-4
VETGRRRRSIGAQRALGRRRRSEQEIDATLIGLVDRVTRRMRRAHRAGRTVVLRLRFDDFARVTRSTTLPHATADTSTVLAAARGLLRAAGPEIRERGLTLVGVSVANVEDANAVQLALPLCGPDTGPLDAALDEVRARFGSAAITRAVLLGRDSGIAMPLLPD